MHIGLLKHFLELKIDTTLNKKPQKQLIDHPLVVLLPIPK